MTCLFAVVARPSTGEQYSISHQFRVRAEAHAHGAPGSIQQGSTAADATALGNERSACGAGEQRESSARSSARTQLDSSAETAVSFSLASTAYANGGHRVWCSSCSFGSCIGRNGEDSEGSANSVAEADIVLSFSPEARSVPYVVQLSTAVTDGGATLGLRARDHDEQTVFESTGSGGSFRLEGRPGRIVRISAFSRAAASDRGGCCSQGRDGSLAVTVSIRRASLGSVGETRRLIGKDTTGFPMVGAVLRNGEMHCSGTVITPRVVLTAAHCVFGYEVSDLTFRLGSNIHIQAEQWRAVSVDVPSEPGGPKYDDFTLADDIALIRLDRDVQVSPARLHAGTPPLGDLEGRRTPLTFVGFGFTLADGEKTGSGVKRQTDLAITRSEPRRFFYAGAGNTCQGDSGGPAFVPSRGRLLLVGVTSAGDRDCLEYGVDTRVDAYAGWIRARLNTIAGKTPAGRIGRR
ncbi:trypsin-like serine protease [Acidobacteria bacterium ACD]|nr:trypsin-like serine protease [Acidobacteria bacterium ACD]